MSKDNLGDAVEYAKEEISSIRWKIEELKDDLENLLCLIDREENDESRACFDMLVKAGFTVGTKFQVDGKGSVWEIIGICREGYIVEYTSDNDGERKETTLKTDRRRYLENNMPRLKIVGGEVNR